MENKNKKEIFTTNLEKMKLFESRYTPDFWENIPLFGAIFYMGRMVNYFKFIHFPELQKNITKSFLVYFFGTLVIGFIIILLFTPWLFYAVLDNARLKTKLELSI